MNKYILAALVATVCLASCGNKSAEPRTSDADFSDSGLVNTKTNQEFEKFYKQFLSDSVFQMQHIQFPLAGGVFECEQVIDWETEGLSMIKEDIRSFDPELDSLITGFSGTVCRFELVRKEVGTYTVMEFKKSGGVWKLVYYEVVTC
ncbi:MAG: hypothetical protein AB7V36_04160 [Bacteroidales bacterium]